MTQTQQVIITLFSFYTAAGVAVGFITLYEARFYSFPIRIYKALKAYVVTSLILGSGTALIAGSIAAVVYLMEKFT